MGSTDFPSNKVIAHPGVAGLINHVCLFCHVWGGGGGSNATLKQ